MLPAMRSEQFSAKISGLDAVGLTRARIATECHLSRGAVWLLAEGIGREPLCSTGHKIGRLHQKVVGERLGPSLIGKARSTRKRPLPWGPFDVERWALGTEKVRQT
ncbi:hypothetical protein [Mesorhizobium sp. L-8-3]|uniref:hypothetical protein n=1 Tax=Mesorhizobium sp. L-8-3 TaxID=2744522 RepID=UPI0019252E7F|nr:hypothetical protein [Mesorhizobium sp. L-8-3]BCH27646.1 hypothetical protein MesoLjLb_74310 [Mesorhizobium sp. L-8-3]